MGEFRPENIILFIEEGLKMYPEAIKYVARSQRLIKALAERPEFIEALIRSPEFIETLLREPKILREILRRLPKEKLKELERIIRSLREE